MAAGMERRRREIELALEQTITASALGGERVVSIVRLVFCVAVGIRAALLWIEMPLDNHEGEKAWITFPALAIAIAFSIAILAGLGRRRTRRLLHVSVTLDAVVAFVALVPNAIWPPPHYQGIPYMLEVSVLLLLAIAAGLRHSASAALLGSALNAASYLALVAVDLRVMGTAHVVERIGPYTVYAVLLVAAVGLALVIAVRTRRLVERAARAALAAEQAGEGLRSVLRDHHDLRTVITSAQIQADLLARRGEAAVVAPLRDDLEELRRQLDQVKGRVLEELAGIERAQPAAVDEASTQVIEALAPRFPEVALETDAADAPAALVAGGPATLRRILANLVVNACEGDGARRARKVAIKARRTGDARIAIEVTDDGPGLPAHVLSTPPGEAVSTKPVGIGFGIGLVDGLVRASGGTVSWQNQSGGGACVVVQLPAAT
jgi:signal transduction histidine kinase